MSLEVNDNVVLTELAYEKATSRAQAGPGGAALRDVRSYVTLSSRVR
jgi:hypothetical protein